jgi:hypothetical protein
MMMPGDPELVKVGGEHVQVADHEASSGTCHSRYCKSQSNPEKEAKVVEA